MHDWHKRVVIDTAKAAIPGKQYIRQVLPGNSGRTVAIRSLCKLYRGQEDPFFRT